jgi:hypothetical protein
MMKTTNVVIADRTFPVGKLPLGPVWDDPDAFAHINGKPNRERFFDKDQFEGWLLTVYHSIDHANVQPPISIENFREALKKIPIDQAILEISKAFVVAMTGSEFQPQPVGGAGEVAADPTTASSALSESAASTA